MIIDAHNHPDWHKHDVRRFLENMDRYGIDRTWLFTWECPRDEYAPAFNQHALVSERGPIPFEHCLRYVEQYPERFVLGYAPDPRRPDAIDQLQAAIDVYGVRVYGELKLRMCYDNPDAIRMFRFCGERGLPVTVHIDYEFETGHTYPRPNWWYGGGIEAFERAIRACPETTFIGHAPGFWAHISGDDQYDKLPYPEGKVMPGGKVVEMLRQYPNLCADLSAGSAYTALHRDLDFALGFCLEFQDRLLFARDYFDGRMQELLDALALTEETRARIYAGNALRLLGE
ncbi:MAG: amidohydrolase family protein [Anaerolineae bacterium]|nr:amidohydrolase family protein [Anaerolineae bacterium]